MHKITGTPPFEAKNNKAFPSSDIHYSWIPFTHCEINLHCFLSGGLPDNKISETSSGLFSRGYAGCIHFFEVHNHHVSRIEEGTNSQTDVYGRSFGGQVDFSNFHLNKDSKDVISSESCILEAIPSTTTYNSNPSTMRPTPDPEITERHDLLNKRTIAFIDLQWQGLWKVSHGLHFCSFAKNVTFWNVA